MNCFYHPGTAAVGICKSCSKGLCPACAVDLGKGLACKGRCESDVAAIIKLVDNSIKRAPINNQLVDSAKVTRFVAPMFNLILGLFFIAFASYVIITTGFEAYSLFTGGLGILFFLYGIFSLIRAVVLALSTPK